MGGAPSWVSRARYSANSGKKFQAAQIFIRLIRFEICHRLVFLPHCCIKKLFAMPKRHGDIVEDYLNGFF